MYQIAVTISTFLLAAALILFYFLTIKPKRDAKNLLKQETKERAEVDRFLSETDAIYGKDNYKDFNETELEATSL